MNSTLDVLASSFAQSANEMSTTSIKTPLNPAATLTMASDTTAASSSTNEQLSVLDLRSKRKHCLFLSKDPVRFEPVSEVTSVFFDESNQQLIISRSNGAGGVVVKSSKDKFLLSLRLEDKGVIRSLNFSNHSKILAILRANSKTVDFVNMYPGYETKEFSQICKLKNSKLLGTCWCHDDEIIFITDKGIEHYQVFPEKLTLKLLKSVSMETHWHFWMSQRNLCILSTGTYANIFYAFIFKDSVLTKLPKFEVPLHSSPPQLLKQKDIILISLYNRVYISHINNNKINQTLHVYLYQVKREGIMRSVEVLTLTSPLNGKLVLHVVDNLVVLHHQWSKTSYIFDIGLDNHVTEGGVKYFQPIICHPICPFLLRDDAMLSGPTITDDQELHCELYSPNWAIFGPDVILDAKLGCYWNLQLDVEALVSFFDDEIELLQILLLRKNSKSLILKLCHDLIEGRDGKSLVSLKTVSAMFDKFNDVIVSKDKDGEEQPKKHVIDQKDVFNQVLAPLEEHKKVSDKVLDGVLIEYMSSLFHHHIRVEHEINDILLRRLLSTKNFKTLQQLLQYHVIPHCKPVALMLLSVEEEFPAGFQIAVDILKHQSSSHECLLEVLLNKKMLLPALRYAQAYDFIDNLSIRKWLEITMATNDQLLFFHVYNYFTNRNLKIRGSARFIASDKCEKYVEYYNKLFNKSSSASSDS